MTGSGKEQWHSEYNTKLSHATRLSVLAMEFATPSIYGSARSSSTTLSRSNIQVAESQRDTSTLESTEGYNTVPVVGKWQELDH